MMLFGIVGCNDESNNTNVNYYSKDKLVHLHQIESDREDLYYDDETGICVHTIQKTESCVNMKMDR